MRKICTPSVLATEQAISFLVTSETNWAVRWGEEGHLIVVEEVQPAFPGLAREWAHGSPARGGRWDSALMYRNELSQVTTPPGP